MLANVNNKLTDSAQCSVPPRYGARSCRPSERWLCGTRIRILFGNSIPGLSEMAFLIIPQEITTTNTTVSALIRFVADSKYLGDWTGNNDLSS